MKTLISILGLSLALAPAMSSAADSTTTTTKTHQVTTAKAEQIAKMDITLSGTNDKNRMEVEKCAKEAGATHASLNAKTGVLTISHDTTKAFEKAKFISLLTTKAPGVSEAVASTTSTTTTTTTEQKK